MFGREAVNLIHRVYKHLIIAMMGVCSLAYIIFANEKPPKYWGLLTIFGVGLATGLMFYGVTSLIVDYKNSRSWREFKQSIIEKFEKAYKS